ncbi:hypothetical protein QZH45_15855 [Pseudomonas corrugata]|uniref:hypothetical protein n=1 Tax=Pseudomonas corrugata TaxID=47879 RepID=UPI003D81334D
MPIARFFGSAERLSTIAYFMTSIYEYLSKVQAGEPINLEALLNRLGASGISAVDASRILVGQKLAKGNSRYAVTIKDELEFASLLVRFAPSKIAGRVGAALDGDSHRSSVSESFLLLRSEQHQHPVVAISESGQWVTTRRLAKSGVIVENLENFLRFHETLTFVSSLLSHPITDAELIFGSGNQVTNGLNGAFLAQFDPLYCLFDVDVGGLRMFKTLKALVPDRAIHFLAPDDIESRLARSKYELSFEHRQELFARYRGMSPETDNLIILMRNSGKTLEQETYLAPLHTEI